MLSERNDFDSPCKDVPCNSLYGKGWSEGEIIDLYRFIDWIMALPEDMEQIYHRKLTEFEE